MNKLSIAIFALMIITTGCAAINNDSYTDEGAGKLPVAEKVSNPSNIDLSESSVALPDIAAYDEPEIPPLNDSATE
jgi:hypothetical protein